MNKKIKRFLKKKNKSKITCLTAYSKNVASILDKHCDLILVGDSLGSVLYNYSSTKEVTLNTMINHSKSVRLGVKRSLMVVDIKTGEKADFGSKKTIIEAFKKNDKRNNEAVNKININNFNFY